MHVIHNTASTSYIKDYYEEQNSFFILVFISFEPYTWNGPSAYKQTRWA